MNKTNTVSMGIFYAISPVHAGSGTSTSAVDLPIQRERHTNWPHVQASAVKGALRAHFRSFQKGEDAQLINYIFGSDEQDGWKRSDESVAAAISVSDCKLLAFPVRSNIAPFVWITCPAVLGRLSNDLEYMGKDRLGDWPAITEDEDAWWINGGVEGQTSVILEDSRVEVQDTFTVEFIKEQLPDLTRLLLVSDELFNYLVTFSTEVQTQIKIDAETGTTTTGSLRYEELLPADSVMYGMVKYENALSGDADLQVAQVRGLVEDVVKDYMQLGGDRTLGRGICRLNWLRGGGA